jgi:hypothetical protein
VLKRPSRLTASIYVSVSAPQLVPTTTTKSSSLG